MVPIIDSHLDLAWNALSWDRDLTEPLDRIRAREIGLNDHPSRGHSTVSLPEMRRGIVRVCLATILARARSDARPTPGHARTDLDFANQSIASATGRGQLEYYRILESQGEVRILRNAVELDDHWRSTSSAIGIVLAMEGADPILSPAQLKPWFEAGLRVLGLSHYGRSAYGVGTGDDGPLTPAGVELLKQMSKLGMSLDLTHSADTSFSQALDHFDGPVLASHNNCRALVPGDRQFSDEQIRRIIDRGGVIGAALDNWMLYPDYKRSRTPRESVPLDAVADHIDHVCQIAGNTRHAAIGSDLDGGFGTEQSPAGVESIADLQSLAPILLARGYAQSDVELIFHGNWLRFLRQHLKG